MKRQNSEEPKNQYLDRLLTTYEKSKESDSFEIKKYKTEIINDIRKLNKEEIVNTLKEDKKITIWMRIKKTLGIG